MDQNNRTPGERIYTYINKNNLNYDEKKDFFYQLTLLDWNKTSEDYGEDFNDKIIQRVIKENIEDLESISNIILLYNNPYGVYTLEFAQVIAKIYERDKIKFIKGLNLVKDEAINIVYVFRLRKVFIDEKKKKRDLEEMQKSEALSKEEKEIAHTFFKMYETICFT